MFEKSKFYDATVRANRCMKNICYHRLNIELVLLSLLELHELSQDRRHLFVSPGLDEELWSYGL